MVTKTIIFFIAMAIGTTAAQADYNDKSEIMAKIQQIDFSADRSSSTRNIITYDPIQWKIRYLPANRNGCFSFRVKAGRDALISLSNAATYTDPKTVIGIGSWANTQTAIIFNDDWSALAKTNTPGILNKDEYRGFWVKWSQHGDILVGKVNEFIPFIVYKFPAEEWYPINFVGVSCATAVKSDWLIDENPSCPYK